MNIVIDIIREYFLITKLHITSLFETIPKKWSVGNKGDVVLVQGFGETWVFLKSLGNRLNSLGFRIHTIKELNYNTQPILVCVSLLDRYIKEQNLHNIVLVSHSKGGIVSKLYLDKDNNANNVSCLFSIATPYQGTLCGYLYFFSLIEAIPGSELVKKVIGDISNAGKINNIYAHIDNHIIPSRNAILPGVQNIKVNIVGHTRILEAEQTFEIIRRFL